VRPITVDAGEDGNWQDFDQMWRNIGKQIGVTVDEFNPDHEAVLKEVLQGWKTQHMMFVFKTIEWLVGPPPPLLTQWLDNFWKPLVQEAQTAIAKAKAKDSAFQAKKLVLILLDYSGRSMQEGIGVALVRSGNEQGYPVVPLLLSVPEQFPTTIVEKWVEILSLANNPAGGLVIPLVKAEQIIKLSNGGRPRKAFQAVVHLCGWKGVVIDTWER
jgi:hypothetical protein